MTERPDLMQRIARVGSRIDPALTDDDVERLVEGSRQRRRRKAVARVGVGVVFAGAAVLAVARLLPTTPPAQTGAERPAVAAEAPPAGQIRFSDGLVATRLDPQSLLTVAQDTPRSISVDLARGRERFEVVPMPERSFVVRAGDVSVTVVGTIFAVERVADRVGVSVERGRVLVDWRSGSRALSAGESGWFPPLVVGDRVTPPEPVAPRERSRTVAAHSPRNAGEVAAPRAHAAPDAPVAVPPAPPPPAESAESLLAAADAAREAGHAEAGAELLRRLLARHRSDPRAPLAAFTLGRVLLMELDRPREAAVAFAQVRVLAPAGPFAEDALAREVEALRKAGAAPEARERAREYLRLYPGGRREQAVKALGGNE